MNSDVVSSCFSADFDGFNDRVCVVEPAARFATFSFSSAKLSSWNSAAPLVVDRDHSTRRKIRRQRMPSQRSNTGRKEKSLPFCGAASASAFWGEEESAPPAARADQ